MRRFTPSLVSGVMLGLLAITLAACGGASKTAASSSPTASAPVVTTLAGTAGTKGSADGTGAAARFDFPIGIASDAVGDLFVADQVNNTIRKVTPSGQVTTLAGHAGASGSTDGHRAAASFNQPTGIDWDTAGDLYVTDRGNNTIRKVTPTGQVATVAGKAGVEGSTDGSASAARFNAPSGIAIDAAGNLYVTDLDNTIRKVTPAGQVTTIAGAPGTGGSVDGRGAAARFDTPTGIAVDAAGNLYVADWGNETIRKITPAGVVTTLAGTAGVKGSADGTGAAARFDGPEDITCDPAGNLYVTDEGNAIIREFTPDGQVTTIAGTAGATGSADGTGSAARFDILGGIVNQPSGNLFVTDQANNTIRKITLGH